MSPSKIAKICAGFILMSSFFFAGCRDQSNFREAQPAMAKGVPGGGKRNNGVKPTTLEQFCQSTKEQTVFSNLSVKNNVTGSDSEFLVSDSLTLSFQVSSKRGLAVHPIRKIEVSTTAGDWQAYPGLSFPLGQRVDPFDFKWSTSLAVASNDIFQIRVSIEDQCGSIVSSISEALNSSAWKIFAGRTDLPENESVRNSMLAPTNDGCSGCLEVLDNDDVLYIDKEIGVRLIDGKTGNARTVIQGDGQITERSAMAKYANLVYLTRPDGIFRFDPSADQPALERYAGGGNVFSGPVPSASQLKILRNSRMAFDGSGNLYVTTSSTEATFSQTAEADGISLYKISMEANGTAGSITLISGTGVRGSINNGQAALNQNLPCNALALSQPAVNEDGSLIYLNCWNSNVLKFFDSKVYVTPISGSFAAYSVFRYNSNDKYFYIGTSTERKTADARKGIMRFMGDAELSNGSNEIVESISSSLVSPNCHLDGSIEDSCPNASAGIAFDSHNQLYFIDGTKINTGGMPLKIRRVIDGNVETIAGDSQFDDRLDRRNQRFGGIGDIVVAANGDVFFADGRLSRIFKISKDEQVVRTYVGSGNVQLPPIASQERLSISLGMPYWGGDNYAIGLMPNQDLVFRSGQQFYQVHSDGNVGYFGKMTTSTKYWHQATTLSLEAVDLQDPEVSSNSALINLGLFNIEFSSGGQMFVSGGYTVAPPSLVSVDPNSEYSLSKIAGVEILSSGGYSRPGTEFNSLSADGTTAKGNPMKCNANEGRDWLVSNLTGNEACHQLPIRVYQHNSRDEVFFGEASSVRRIDENGKYQTLATNLNGTITNFVIDPNFNRLFYTNTDGEIYCKWLNANQAAPSNCSGGKIEIPPYFPKPTARYTDGLALVDGGLLVSTGRVVLKYSY